MTDQQGEWLTVEETVKLLGVTRRTVHRYAQTGKLTAYTTGVGRRTMFRRADVEALLTPRPLREPGEAAA